MRQMNGLFLRRLWCRADGEVQYSNFISKELIRVKFPTWRDSEYNFLRLCISSDATGAACFPHVPEQGACRCETGTEGSADKSVLNGCFYYAGFHVVVGSQRIWMTGVPKGFWWLNWWSARGPWKVGFSSLSVLSLANMVPVGRVKQKAIVKYLYRSKFKPFFLGIVVYKGITTEIKRWDRDLFKSWM